MGSRRGSSLSGEWHDRLDLASGAVLLFIAAYAPWAANTHVPWLTHLLVGSCWLSGLLLVAKWITRPHDDDPNLQTRSRRWISHAPGVLMALLSFALIAQVAVSVWNYSAVVTRLPDGLEWTYREARPGWPTTFDRDATSSALLRYIGLVAVFWAMRDWILRGGSGRGSGDEGSRPRMPRRLRWLVWALALSGASMALVGIVHRLDKAKDLLWLMPLKDTPFTQMFGSFPYRANAGQYFNLIWPLLVGSWIASQRSESIHSLREGRTQQGGSESFLLVCAGLMVAAIFTAASRMAIAIALVQMVLVVFLAAISVTSWKLRGTLAGGMVLALVLGWFAQGDFLRKRFENAFVDETMSGRTSIYAYARPLADRLPTWGWGAEAFRTYGELHRHVIYPNPEFVHDDPWEVRGGMGWVGLGVVLGCLALVPAMAASRNTIQAASAPLMFLWLGGVGLLVHACVDYPLQVPVIQVTCILLAGVASACSWRRRRSRGAGA
jgi:hypothetical protein